MVDHLERDEASKKCGLGEGWVKDDLQGLSPEWWMDEKQCRWGIVKQQRSS